jgi:HAD superfamily hydrolase (TIGR01509 family)
MSKEKSVLTIDTILFDLDGTLIDTEPAAARAVEKCFGKFGMQVTHEDACYVTGRTWEMAFQYLLEKYQPKHSPEEIAKTVIEQYRQELKQGVDAVPGSADCVRALAESGLKMGLVSGSFRSEIFWALEQLGIRQHFEVVLGAEDYPRSKPAPDGYAKALGLLTSDASRTLVFEDSHPGIASGRAVGAWVAAVTGQNAMKQDTSAAHWHLKDLTQVNATWVRSLRQPE